MMENAMYGTGGIIVVILAVIGRAYRNGTLQTLVKRRKNGHKRDEQLINTLHEVKETTYETKETVECIDDKVEGVSKAIVVLHKDELSENPLLRDQIGIDGDSDFLRGD